MRHNKKFNHLGRTASHRNAMLSNMACSLIKHKRITTTVAKAKALKKFVEPLITKSKEDTTNSRRVVFSNLQDKFAVTELFKEISVKVADRPGGYTRIIKTGHRLGDNAEMCFIELVDYNENMAKTAAKKATRTRRSKKVCLDELDIIFYDDDQTKLIAYENGDIDLADLNASLLSQYEANYADEITAYHPLGTAFISLNLNDQYLSNVNVRKAISLAINREELVSAVLNGAGIPATSYLNNGIPGHDDSLSVYEYDPEQAKALLAEAGYADGITISSEVRQADQAVFSAIQGYLAEVGINLDLTVVDNATYNSDRTAGKIPMTGTTWNALYPDGDFQMYNYFYSSKSDAQGVFYHNDEFDKLLDDARKSTDEDARAEMYKEADKILSQDDYACIPLYYPQSQFIAKPYVKNYKVGNLIYHFWNADIDTAVQNQ